MVDFLRHRKNCRTRTSRAVTERDDMAPVAGGVQGEVPDASPRLGRVETMDFELNDEQRAFRATLRRFVEQEITPVATEWERTGRYPTEIVDKMREMGLFGMTVPERYGGLQLDAVSFALVFEEISRGWMGVAGILGSHSLSCWMISKYGTEAQ